MKVIVGYLLLKLLIKTYKVFSSKDKNNLTELDISLNPERPFDKKKLENCPM